MNTTQVFTVANSLRPWLMQRPTESEILEYAKRLTDEQVKELQEALIVLMREFYDELFVFMKSIGWGPLFTDRQINDQFATFADLTQYNASSVAKNLSQFLNFPTLPQAPSELPKAVWGFLAVWSSAVSLKAAPYFFENSLLVDSLLTTSLTTAAQFEKMKEDTLALLQRDEEHADSGKPYSPGEIDTDTTHFKSLGFLPDDFAKSLGENQYGYDRLVITQRILRVLSIVDILGFEAAKANPALVKERLWQVLRLSEEDAVMVVLETERELKNNPDTHLQEEAAFLARTWTPEAILGHTAAQKTLERIASYTNEAKQAYREVFGDMMIQNPFVQYTFGEENAQAVIGVLESEYDLAVVRRVIDALKEELILDEIANDAETILTEISAVFQALPIVAEVPRYSRAAVQLN